MFAALRGRRREGRCRSMATMTMPTDDAVPPAGLARGIALDAVIWLGLALVG